MSKNLMIVLAVIVVGVFALVGCGSDDADSDMPIEADGEIDAPVEGVPPADNNEIPDAVDSEIPTNTEGTEMPDSTRSITVQGNAVISDTTYSTRSTEVLGWKDQEGPGPVVDITCSVAGKTLDVTFTVQNPHNTEYFIGGDTEQMTESTHQGIQLSANGKRIRIADAMKACGATSLAPDGKVTCNVQRTIRRKYDKTQRNQNVQVRAVSFTSKVAFTCPE